MHIAGAPHEHSGAVSNVEQHRSHSGYIAEIDYRPRQGEGYIVSTSGGKWPILGYGMIAPPNYDEFILTMRRCIK
jgi:hypothetical protein